MEASFSSVSSNSNMSDLQVFGHTAGKNRETKIAAGATKNQLNLFMHSLRNGGIILQRLQQLEHVRSASVWPHCGKKPRNQNRRGRDEEPTESLHAQPPEWRHHSPASPATRTCPAQPQSDWRLYWNPRPLRRTPPAAHSDQSHATTSADRSATYPKSIWFLPSRYPLRR